MGLIIDLRLPPPPPPPPPKCWPEGTECKTNPDKCCKDLKCQTLISDPTTLGCWDLSPWDCEKDPCYTNQRAALKNIECTGVPNLENKTCGIVPIDGDKQYCMDLSKEFDVTIPSTCKPLKNHCEFLCPGESNTCLELDLCDTTTNKCTQTSKSCTGDQDCNGPKCIKSTQAECKKAAGPGFFPNAYWCANSS